MKHLPQNIIISRTDSIGDVVLTLPVAAVLRNHFPQAVIAFLGKPYTRPVIEASGFVDMFLDVDDFLKKDIRINHRKPEVIIHVFPTAAIAARAKQLGIPIRIGTTNRLYHWYTCNRLVKLSRKNSPLHEAQLNLKLLKGLGIRASSTLEELGILYGLEKLEPLQQQFSELIKRDKYNLILHPKSQGSGREWPLERYVQLIQSLNPEQYRIFISGTEKERPLLQPLLRQADQYVTDLIGKMSLSQFISFIQHCDGLVASGTGPIHLAAALGKDALALYPPIRPVHPDRWRPLGPNVKVFVQDKDCNTCSNNPSGCYCIQSIEATRVKSYLDKIACRSQDHF